MIKNIKHVSKIQAEIEIQTQAQTDITLEIKDKYSQSYNTKHVRTHNLTYTHTHTHTTPPSLSLTHNSIFYQHFFPPFLAQALSSPQYQGAPNRQQSKRDARPEPPAAHVIRTAEHPRSPPGVDNRSRRSGESKRVPRGARCPITR